jgi:hypothetical protein
MNFIIAARCYVLLTVAWFAKRCRALPCVDMHCYSFIHITFLHVDIVHANNRQQRQAMPCNMATFCNAILTFGNARQCIATQVTDPK